jgi:hypothetical protein
MSDEINDPRKNGWMKTLTKANKLNLKGFVQHPISGCMSI